MVTFQKISVEEEIIEKVVEMENRPKFIKVVIQRKNNNCRNSGIGKQKRTGSDVERYVKYTFRRYFEDILSV